MHNQKVKAFLRKRSFVITGGMALLAILAAFLIGAVLMLLMGINPIRAYHFFLYGAFGNIYGFGETINKFTPLLCCALSFAIAQKSGFFNLGSEGQLYAGALCSVLVASHMQGAPAILTVAVSIVAGMAGGAVLSTIAGLLRIWFGANELLTTMMLNYIMQYVIALLVSGALKNRNSSMEQTPPIPAGAQLPVILKNSRLHAGIFIALAALFLVWFLQQRTVPGFEMRLSGINRNAAKYAGVRETRALLIVIVLCGALAGLGGSMELLGNQYKLMNGFSNNYGFDGIGIAVMGQYQPIGILLSTLLFAAFRTGTAAMQRGMGVPTPILYILQGVVVIAVITSNYFVGRIKNALVEGRAIEE